MFALNLLVRISNGKQNLKLTKKCFCEVVLEFKTMHLCVCVSSKKKRQESSTGCNWLERCAAKLAQRRRVSARAII